MRVSELTGALLDYWVAMAEGQKAYIRRQRMTLHNEDGSLHKVLVDEDRCFRKSWKEEDQPASECKGGYWLGYSSHWDLGGPIMDTNAIGFHPISDAEWMAEEHITARTGRGPTPLVAAMRAYVASKFGDEVADGEAS